MNTDEKRMVRFWEQEVGILYDKIDEERTKDLPSPGYLDQWHARVNYLNRRIDGVRYEAMCREAAIINGYGPGWKP